MVSKSKTKRLTLEDLPPRIVIKFLDTLDLPYTSEEEISDYILKKQILPLQALKEKFPGIKLNKFFTSVEPAEIIKSANEAAKLSKLRPGYKPPNFLTYFVMDCPYKTETDGLLQALKGNKNVSYAYLQSDPAIPPCVMTGANPGLTHQGYLEPARLGINAKYAWQFNGGCGEGQVKFIDIEYAWIREHEDIAAAGVEFLWGNKNYALEKDHGTSVLGVILMQDNGDGGLGIASKNKNAAVVSQIMPDGTNSIADAIQHAITKLDFGDVLLLETQVIDTREPIGLRPAETEQAIFEQIEEAVNRGIIVIEAAGNGNESQGYNLNDYTDTNGMKILDRGDRDFKDSGAIIVGAASATRSHGKTRTSNYGNRVDCFAWGKNVYTADDPDNYPPNEEPYTKQFSGTSSASAIIAGATISIQSIIEASGKQRLGSMEMRDILSNPANGSRSSSNNIGVMPNLKKIIDNVIPGLP